MYLYIRMPDQRAKFPPWIRCSLYKWATTMWFLVSHYFCLWTYSPWLSSGAFGAYLLSIYSIKLWYAVIIKCFKFLSHNKNTILDFSQGWPTVECFSNAKRCQNLHYACISTIWQTLTLCHQFNALQYCLILMLFCIYDIIICYANSIQFLFI